MRDAKDMIADVERSAGLTAAGAAAQQQTWTATVRPHGVSDFESVLLAIAGHDLRQPLQVVQSAHELLGMGIRTSSELRHLRSGQNAIDRLKEQLAQLQTALRIREHTKGLKLTPVCLKQVLRQVYRENEEAALRKGISLRMVSSDATIMSDCLLLGAALRNLVSNAVKYTEPGAGFSSGAGAWALIFG
jgi:two-component system, OmpR family, phosphate regulon sensor histidine kinase PhoR